MSNLLERCRVNTNVDSDVFVGIQKKNSNDLYEISFPLGYHLSDDDKELRKDILSLLSVLSRFSLKKESEIFQGINHSKNSQIPVQAYLFVIKDYFERGYYKQRENCFQTAKKGRIDWRRTIKTQKFIIEKGEAYYLDYVIKKNNINENELITIVHQYCVYESFEKLGWLFTAYVPPKPTQRLSIKHMMAIVQNKMQETFNDKNRQLFTNMLAILKVLDVDTNSEFRYGTSHFEYVWEKMIDHVFGISEKEEYFPKTAWKMSNGDTYQNSVLEPDSIMLLDEKIYVLDAKYYKFGETGFPGHLPGTASINKQITYGEYIAESEKFKKNGMQPLVYNAFIMPYNSQNNKFNEVEKLFAIGSVESDWKDGSKEYENVVGILVDVKHLMRLGTRQDYNEMLKLATEIEKMVS